MKEEAKSVSLIMFVTKGHGMLVKKALLLNLTPCWRSRRNQRAIKEAKSLSWQRKISLVLKLMKMLEEQRQKCWKDEDRETILRSVFKKMEKTNVAR